MLLRGRGHFLDRLDVFRMIELRGDAEEIRQIEMAEPEHIHARHRCDLVHVLDALGGFDQAHDQRAFVGEPDFFCDTAADVIVGRESERGATATGRRIACARDDVPRLFGRTHHRRHDAHDTEVQRARDVVILVCRHPRHRHQVEPATQGGLFLERFVAGPRMLHVDQQEFRAARLNDLRQTRHQELPAEGTEDRLAF